MNDIEGKDKSIEDYLKELEELSPTQEGSDTLGVQNIDIPSDQPRINLLFPTYDNWVPNQVDESLLPIHAILRISNPKNSFSERYRDLVGVVGGLSQSSIEGRRSFYIYFKEYIGFSYIFDSGELEIIQDNSWFRKGALVYAYGYRLLRGGNWEAYNGYALLDEVGSLIGNQQKLYFIIDNRKVVGSAHYIYPSSFYYGS